MQVMKKKQRMKVFQEMQKRKKMLSTQKCRKCIYCKDEKNATTAKNA